MVVQAAKLAAARHAKLKTLKEERVMWGFL